MIDDFGYVKQDRDEMEVLFTLKGSTVKSGIGIGGVGVQFGSI